MERKMNFIITKERREEITKWLGMTKEQFVEQKYVNDSVLWGSISFYDDEICVYIELVTDDNTGCHIDVMLGRDKNNDGEEKVMERIINREEGIEILAKMEPQYSLDFDINFQHEDDNYIITLR